MAKVRLNSSVRREIVNVFRDWATAQLNTTDAQRHIDFANTIFNGKRQNSQALFNIVSVRVNLPQGTTKSTIENLIRRAVGKGSLTDGTSPEVIGYFKQWRTTPAPKSNITTATSNIAAIARRSSYADVQPARQSGVMAAQHKQVVQAATPVAITPAKTRKTSTKVAKVPVSTAEIIQSALTNTQFTATELLTKKFTVVEFLDRIGIKVQG